MGKAWFLRLRTAAVICAVSVMLCQTAWADGTLIPVGQTVGIQIQTDGVLVAGTTEIETAGGSASPAKDAGIRAGDLIIALNGQPVGSAAELMAAVEGLTDAAAEITVERNGQLRRISVSPARQTDGSSRLGLWLRDGVAGIGTVTYVDPETGEFGALGHGVNDMDTGVLLPVGDGTLCRAQIVSVKQGVSGAPGALSGSFDAGDVIGRIESNTACGIFGQTSGDFDELGQPVPVADAGEIVSGPATILACVDGVDTREYDVEITRTGMAAGGGRDLMVQVTDPELLALTGGIVQGMSGSPILQNGKLVGAVTHVCVSG